MRLSEEKLVEIEARCRGGEPPEGGWPALVSELIADLRETREELSQAPTREQMQAVVSQLKEVRGENSRLRAESSQGQGIVGKK